MYKQASDRGVTMIELLVVLAVIGIIVAIAVPSYNTYSCNARKSDATTALVKMAQLQEQYYLQNNTYAASANINVVGGANTQNGYYTVAITSADASSFELAATDVNAATGGSTCDSACAVLTINAAGQRLPAACWQ